MDLLSAGRPSPVQAVTRRSRLRFGQPENRAFSTGLCYDIPACPCTSPPPRVPTVPKSPRWQKARNSPIRHCRSLAQIAKQAKNTPNPLYSTHTPQLQSSESQDFLICTPTLGYDIVLGPCTCRLPPLQEQKNKSQATPPIPRSQLQLVSASR